MRRLIMGAGRRNVHNHNTITAPHLLRWRKALAA